MLSLGGTASRTFQVDRNTTANTAGSNLTLLAGGATALSTNKNGGTLYLSSGTASGTGSSTVEFQTATSGTTGTSDRAPTTKMVIDGAGNLGIGTTATSSKLEVQGKVTILHSSGATGTDALSVGVAGSSKYLFAQYDTTADAGRIGAYDSAGAGSMKNLYIAASNVGIGTTSPGAKLEVAGTAGTDGIKFPDGTTQVTAAHSAYATVYRASSYSPAGVNTWYDLPMTSEQSKSNITHSNSTNPERVQVISSGVYLITYSVNAMSNGTNGGTCTARLVKNNTTENAGTFASAAPAVGGYSVVISSSSAVSLNAADYVTVQVACNTSPNTYVGSNAAASPTTQSVASMTIVRLQ